MARHAPPFARHFPQCIHRARCVGIPVQTSPKSVHVRNEEIDRWDHPVDDLCVSLNAVNTQNTDARKATCMIGLIPHIISLVMFVTMKGTLVWMCRTNYNQGLRELSAIRVEQPANRPE
ncbi:hypothetical protein PLEOSDRAFT_162997 [Pleurotus ostreatus PC15]|uniref:Uncharacterized protein n=1 Tax=Pleurotus ostreatus (strain PC15) TaxID=1137138 RepID=A0A067N242_PLEO1|nr:hypothetical protein PLEOSDRAFT_162997 [Pleurotus ostreatus PC15]